MSIEIVPCFHAEAAEFVANFHRHNKPPIGSVFCVGASDGTRLVGVQSLGAPWRGWCKMDRR
ncbi:hypothetical protein UFOVP853_8 [uncultured Caudovirales phage]|uniref:Uncharacterized protein n=1 Tax=uncultured Caudovirales phage TaxID=2100421 RepID=A0A6J5P2D8_9CAUD|nr:hypothetical protein UFOVP853_8 [uncultured Caudovirales phage]